MTSLFLFAPFFATGLVVGSFLNVVILRGARSQSLGGRSRCDSCAKTLGIGELIPLISFLIQKRRCRSCSAALSWQYPIVESATAVSFAGAAWYIFSLSSASSLAVSQWLLASGYWLLASVAIAAGIVILVSDLRWQIIPNGAVAALLAAAGGAAAIRALGNDFRISSGVQIVWDLQFALIFAAVLALIWFVSRGRAMGLGDAKLIFASSLLVGFPASISAVLFSFWLGGIAGVLLLAAGAGTLKSRIPFGPFILAGTALAYFFSELFLAFTGLDLLL